MHNLPLCNFEIIQNMKEDTLLINTLNNNNQQCLIYRTLDVKEEEQKLNDIIRNRNKNIKIILYGKNSHDVSIYKKYKQLKDLGLYNIFIYSGGLFEWLLLQDVYGSELFPTTNNEIDILKFK